MKGIFKDSKDWKIKVAGDWRYEDGKPSKYKPKKSSKEVYISGGLGMYFFQKGRFDLAVGLYLKDLEVIGEVEKEEKIRFHKGLFYYQIGLCYMNMKGEDLAKAWFQKAKEEDEITYGDLAKTFPASKL